MKTVFRYIIALSLLMSVNKCYSQNRISIDASGVDTSLNVDDVNHNYIILWDKDSSHAKLFAVIKYYDPGTRNIINIDSMNHPIEFTGIKEFDDIEYTYKWKWSTKGKLLYTEVYWDGKLYRKIKMY